MPFQADLNGLTRRRAIMAAVAASASATSPMAARASSYPSGPVTVIVAFPAGAGTDIVTRVLTEKLARLWKQPVIVDNKGGGNGIVAA